MIVWGGHADSNYPNTGARYKTILSSWTATSMAGACPTPRTGHSAVWTGREMIVWGGTSWNHAKAAGGLYRFISIQLSPATLPDGRVGMPYSQTLTASGGTPPYTFAVAPGSLPPGLSLSSAGVLSGTPTTAGSSTFAVMVTDSVGCEGSRQSVSLIVVTTASSSWDQAQALSSGHTCAPSTATTSP